MWKSETNSRSGNRPRRTGLAILLLLAGCSCTTTAEPSKTVDRQAQWATAIKKEGLPNLHKISPDFYRGAQPTAEGMRELEKMGIKTVICLRAGHSDQEELSGTTLSLEHVPVKTWSPSREDVVRVLKILTDKDRSPVFLHCQHGADRTGVMCATYRVVVCDWTKEEAIQEMTEGGFGYHPIWVNLIGFVKNLDVESIRKEAGVVPQKGEKPANSP